MLRERGRGDDDALIFTNAIGNKFGHWDRVTKRLQQLSGTSGWHRHDIRRTCATILGEAGVSPHVIEVALAHSLRTSSDGSPVSRVAPTYNKSRYHNEHRDALQRLADELDKIAAGENTNVVPLRA